MIQRAILARLLACTMIALLALSTVGGRAAAAQWEGVGGWEGDSHHQGYGFLALSALLPSARGLIVPVRVSVSYLYYQYDSSGTQVSVNSPGVSLLSGARLHRRGATGDVLAGVEVRRDQRTSNAAGAPTSEMTRPGVEVMADADLDLANRWNSYLLLDYAGADRYWYGSGDLKYQLTNLEWSQPTVWFVGASAVREGNDESDAVEIGGFMEQAIVRSTLSVGLSAGYQNSGSPGEARRTGGYLGVSLYRRF